VIAEDTNHGISTGTSCLPRLSIVSTPMSTLQTAIRSTNMRKGGPDLGTILQSRGPIQEINYLAGSELSQYLQDHFGKLRSYYYKDYY
jgi:hypothetical protein